MNHGLIDFGLERLAAPGAGGSLLSVEEVLGEVAVVLESLSGATLAMDSDLVGESIYSASMVEVAHEMLCGCAAASAACRESVQVEREAARAGAEC